MMQNDQMTLHDVDVADFMKTLDSCKGDVYLETAEGDVLNLRSKLCLLMGLENILRGAVISEATIRCTRPEDEELLFRFNLFKEVPKKD